MKPKAESIRMRKFRRGESSDGRDRLTIKDRRELASTDLRPLRSRGRRRGVRLYKRQQRRYSEWAEICEKTPRGYNTVHVSASRPTWPGFVWFKSVRPGDWLIHPSLCFKDLRAFPSAWNTRPVSGTAGSVDWRGPTTLCSYFSDAWSFGMTR